MNGSNPKSDFVDVNGIRLHYLDWGGSGPTPLVHEPSCKQCGANSSAQPQSGPISPRR